ncbi:alkaline phosphatase [Deinobacterium chartae]|uniref:Alkaline phosphatase n=1 Tax=Deinobacterium chartae TaxID=521158 RepID=A0A841I0D9_9DEIO|nr:alkaline phosphatase [Deinobacterium chartae]
MKRHALISLSLAALTVPTAQAQTAWPTSGTGAAPRVLATYTLPDTSIRALNPFLTEADLAQALANGWKGANLPALGSALVSLGDGRFVGLTDRGPNGDCKDGKSFPLARFAPTLVPFHLEGERIVLDAPILIRNADGTPVSGLSNLPSDDVPYTGSDCSATLPLDPGGLDPEDLQPLPGGRWAIVEEYSSSLLILEADGRIVVRYVPQGTAAKLAGARYPVKDLLPPIFAQRRNNRGFENLAVSPDGKQAFAILQSPIGSTKDDRYKESRIVRAVRLDLSDPLNARVTGEFLVEQSPAKDYPSGKQSDMKFSAAVWLGEDRVLLLERTEGDASGKGNVKLYVTDFSAATDVSGRPEASSSDFVYENVATNLSSLGVTPARRTEVFSQLDTPEIQSFKVEGLAVLTPGTVALTNDNDFAINGTEGPSKLWVVQLGQALQ